MINIGSLEKHNNIMQDKQVAKIDFSAGDMKFVPHLGTDYMENNCPFLNQSEASILVF